MINGESNVRVWENREDAFSKFEIIINPITTKARFVHESGFLYTAINFSVSPKEHNRPWYFGKYKRPSPREEKKIHTPFAQ